MNEWCRLGYSLFAGFFLGAFFFAGLWWTIQSAMHSAQPALWFLCSMLFRCTLLLGGFYFMPGNNWHKLLAGLAGFILSRQLATRLSQNTEARHAP